MATGHESDFANERFDGDPGDSQGGRIVQARGDSSVWSSPVKPSIERLVTDGAGRFCRFFGILLNSLDFRT
jgi:hypothetical protein